MIDQLSLMEEPKWLMKANRNSILYSRLPLDSILHSSVYYPASGVDGDPIKYLAGNFYSFVYVDYGYSREELNKRLTQPGFRGYELVAIRDVAEQELLACRPFPLFLSIRKNRFRFSEQAIEPFCYWIVFQRLDAMPDSHGPKRFSVLYICADGVATYEALYTVNEIAPSCIAIIQPGRGFGGNWTDFEDPHDNLAWLVRGKPGCPRPRYLINGGIGLKEFYRTPCWPEYNRPVRLLLKAGQGSIRIWENSLYPSVDK
ncbi:hypothetical protein ACVA51_24925 (plasmid) [Pseudomonas luteola]